LKTPTKDAKAAGKLEFTLREESPDTADSGANEDEPSPEGAELEELRKQFVGDAGTTKVRVYTRYRCDTPLTDVLLRQRAPSGWDQASLRTVPYPVP